MADAAAKTAEKAKNDTAATGGKAVPDASGKPATPGKSIIGEKYRDGRYKKQDWLGEQIAGVVSLQTERTRRVPIEGKEGEFKEVTETVNDGVDVGKLFKLARENGLNVDKYEDQRDSHGFPGRFRMTVRNMLQAETKRRHGLVINGKFVPADPAWLASKGAGAAPTHNEKGEKIAKPKAEEAPKAADAKAKEPTKK